MRKLVAVVLGMLVIAGMIAGCKKAENQPAANAVPQAPQQIPAAPLQSPMEHASQQMPAQAPMPPHGDSAAMASKERSIVVPDAVKGTWSRVVLAVQDKTSNTTGEYKVKLKSDFKIPNSDLKIAVGDFLPDFKMSENTLTSGSNEPNNAAVNVEIFEGGKSIFKGWLFSKFPAMHPFQHPKYAITLKEGLKG
jgi:hypothetical protein